MIFGALVSRVRDIWMELIIKLEPRGPGSEAFNFEANFGEIESDESLSQVLMGQGSKPSRL